MSDYLLLKLCGLTQVEGARYGAYLGFDYLGMVRHPGSPRYCSVEKVDAILSAVPERKKVLVYGSGMVSELNDDYNRFGALGVVFQVPVTHEGFSDIARRLTPERLLPVVHVAEGVDLNMVNELGIYPLLVFDTGGKKDLSGEKLDGGTGVSFNWELVKNVRRKYLVAGGVNPDNISAARDLLSPAGFDLSSGVELSPGVKDLRKLEQIVQRSRGVFTAPGV